MREETARDAEIAYQLERLAAASAGPTRSDIKARKSAVFYLGELLSDGETESPPAVDALRHAASRDESDLVRSFAFFALKAAQLPLDAGLIACASEDSASNVRLALADYLGEVDSPNRTEILEALASDPIVGVRIHAVQAYPRELSVSEDFFVAKLQDEEKLVRYRAMRALEEIGGEKSAEALSARSAELGRRERRRMRSAARQIANRK